MNLFRYGDTEMGGEVPPVFGLKLLLFLAFVPLAVTVAFAVGRYDMLAVYGVLIFSHVWDRLTSYEFWGDGHLTGREDYVEEMWQAWTDREITPQEYLLREAWLSERDHRAARVQVQRSARRARRFSRSS